MRDKTGTLTGVNALSGIVAGEHGGARYFTIIVNHQASDGVQAVIDAMAREIAAF